MPLVYLDSANSAQKPQVVIDAEADLYANHYANVARAVHTLGSEVTNAYEGARDKVAAFLNAPSRDEIIFTRNITEALNLLAYSFSNATTFPGAERFRLGPGDEIVVTEMEHHSNIVPWQQLALRTGATFRWIPIDDEGRLVESAIDEIINERTKVVSFVYQSNALGTINPVRRITDRARSVGALSIVDAAQAAPHLPLDVQELGADFVAFTGHKLYGPTGVGVLWGRYELLADLPPFLGGGEMIETVAMEGSTFAAPPHRFEAGTPMIAQAVALGTAVDYVTELGIENIREHEKELTAYALEGLQTDRRVCASSGRPRRSTAARRSRSRSRASTRTTSRNCSTSRASRCAPVITAPVRYASGTEYRRPRERHSVCTRRWMRSTRSSQASARCRRSFLERLDGHPLPADHPGPLQEPASPRRCSNRSTPRCTTSTRPAVTRSPCASR